jgi:hypothetical protein
MKHRLEMLARERAKQLDGGARHHGCDGSCSGGSLASDLKKVAHVVHDVAKKTHAVSTIAGLTGNPAVAVAARSLGYGADDYSYSSGGSRGKPGVVHTAKFYATHPHYIAPDHTKKAPSQYNMFVKENMAWAREQAEKDLNAGKIPADFSHGSKEQKVTRWAMRILGQEWSHAR